MKIHGGGTAMEDCVPSYPVNVVNEPGVVVSWVNKGTAGGCLPR